MGDLEKLTEAFLTASRALVGVAVRSIAASPVPVTVPQHRVLVLLASRGAQTINQVADHLGVNQSNASRLCDRLERLGLLARRRFDEDRRVVHVTPTRQGTRVVDAVTRHRRHELRAILEQLPAVDAGALVAALDAFNDAAGEPADDLWTSPPPATR